MELKKYKDKFSEYTYYLKDGKEVLHGIYKEYDKNGELRAEHNYKNGKLHGLCKGYYEDGKIRVEYNYKNGKLHGLCKGYDKNGKLETENNYKNSKPHGLCKRYDEDGELEFEYNYKDGELEEYEHKKEGDGMELKTCIISVTNFDREKRAELKAIAKRHSRTVSGECRYILEEAIKNDKVIK